MYGFEVKPAETCFFQAEEALVVLRAHGKNKEEDVEVTVFLVTNIIS